MPNIELPRNYKIPGWYDEQRLGEASAGQAKLSNIFGAMHPIGDLTRFQQADLDGVWVPMARLEVSGDDDQTYLAKLNIVKGKDELPSNVVSICHRVPGDPTKQCTLGESIVSVTGKTCDAKVDWFARVVNTNKEMKWFCVEYSPHYNPSHPDDPANPPMPGTARWAWDDNDEKGWISCPQGCCKIS
jgi:hypothetical protein